MFPSTKRLREDDLTEVDSYSECFQRFNEVSSGIEDNERRENPECCFKLLLKDRHNGCTGLDLTKGRVMDKAFVFETPLLSQSIYFLNKSYSKWVCVGLCGELFFEPLVRIVGVKKQCVSLTVEEWEDFLKCKEELKKYFKEKNNVYPVIQSRSVAMSFDCFDGINKILKLEKNGQFLYISYDGMEELWKLEALIKCRINNLRELNYGKFYKELIDKLMIAKGDLENEVEKLLQGAIVENVCITWELIFYDLKKIISDIRLCRVAYV